MNSVTASLRIEEEKDQTEEEVKIIFGGRIIGMVSDLDEEAAKELFEKVKNLTQAEIAWIFLGKEFSLFHIGGPESRIQVKNALKLFVPSRN